MGVEALAMAPSCVPIGNPSGDVVGNIEGNRAKGPLRLLPGCGIVGPPAAELVGGGAGAGAGGAGGGGSTNEVGSGWPPIRGGGLRTSLATVLRVTNGMIGAFASSAPEPTLMVMLSPVEPAGPPAPRVGTPVMLPGKTLEMPPKPSMKNGVLIGVPLTLEAVLGPGPSAEPEGETKAPGNGISNM
jgi:hypothetical protein